MEALPCELGANKGKDKDKDKEEGAQSHMTKLIWGLENVDSHLLDTDTAVSSRGILCSTSTTTSLPGLPGRPWSGQR
jgi:hypothetical protein